MYALEKALSTAKRAITDAVARDIIKQMRYALGDKALPIQRAAANVSDINSSCSPHDSRVYLQVLVVMYPLDDGTRTVSEVESIITLCTRSLEGSDQLTRQALSKLVAHILASTQVQRVIPVIEPSKKTKKGQNVNEDDDDPAPNPHVAAEEAKPIMAPTEMFAQLSKEFNKPQASRKTRIGIFDFYAALLTRLGSSFVENNYALIVQHLMTEIVANPRNSTTRYETLMVRTLVGLLLRDLIGIRMLGEQSQIAAIQELSNSYLKRWPAMMPGQVAPSSLCIVIAAKEVAGMLQQLGNAPPPVQVCNVRILLHSKLINYL